MIRFGEWCIDADSRCYTIGKQKTRVTKDGKTEEYIADAKYYSTLTAAFEGIKEAERRSLVHTQDMTIQEAVKRICESDDRMIALFEKVGDDA